MHLGKIFAIVKKDFDIEIRQKYAVGGVILFAVTSAYFIYKTFTELVRMEWNILLWFIVLYAGLNAIVKSFLQERQETYLYYYTLFDPLDVILGKLIYNILFMLFLSGIVIGVFTILLGNPIVEHGLFYQGLFLGVIGISAVFTFVSSVSGAGGANSTMMSILALPLVLPNVLLMQKVTSVSMRLIQDSSVSNDLFMMFGIDLLMIGMMLLIFPSVWRS